LRRVVLDTYTCSEELYVGFMKCGLLNCKSLTVVGYLHVRGLATVEELVLVGRGYVNILAGKRIFMASYNGAVVVDNLAGEKVFLIGGKHPVIARRVKAVELYASNTLIGEVYAKSAYIGKRVGIRVLKELSQLVFLDYHSWIERIEKKPEIIIYAYHIIGEKTRDQQTDFEDKTYKCWRDKIQTNKLV